MTSDHALYTHARIRQHAHSLVQACAQVPQDGAVESGTQAAREDEDEDEAASAPETEGADPLASLQSAAQRQVEQGAATVAGLLYTVDARQRELHARATAMQGESMLHASLDRLVAAHAGKLAMRAAPVAPVQSIKSVKTGAMKMLMGALQAEKDEAERIKVCSHTLMATRLAMPWALVNF